MTRAAIYGRVSTPDQVLDVQLVPLREYTARRGWPAPVEFSDVASGAERKRRGLDALMSAARKRSIDTVIVVKLDRLGWSIAHLVGVLDELRALGIEFVALDQGIDTTTPAGRLMLAVIAGIAEFERELIRERTRAGLAAARARGVKLGRRPVVVDVEHVRTLRSTGSSIRQIAKALGVSVGRVHQTVREIEAQARGEKQVAEAVQKGTE